MRYALVPRSIYEAKTGKNPSPRTIAGSQNALPAGRTLARRHQERWQRQEQSPHNTHGFHFIDLPAGTDAAESWSASRNRIPANNCCCAISKPCRCEPLQP